MLESPVVDTRVPFVGRAEDLREILAFLKRGGVLTLVGPGGVGKSRLAREAIWRHSRSSPIESVFIPLAGVAPEAVVGTIMTALGVGEESGRTPHQVLADRLRDRAIVLVLDNCEHAPDETAALIDTLAVLGSVTILATSQRRLDYAGETVFDVGPFTCEDGVAFFVARAGIEPERIDERALATIATIVERVDGLAVALDLAAARLASLSLERLADELADLRPYQLRSTRGSEPRHRTIGNVIAWSYSRLGETAKRAFAQVSLFATDFDAEDVAALGDLTPAEAREALDELAANSLTVAIGAGYRMLLPIRAVALRMFSAQRNRRALERAFAVRMNRVAIGIRAQMSGGGNAGAAVAYIHNRYADFCAALAWALKRPQERVEQVSEIPTAVMALWAEGGRFAEGLRWIERLESIALRLSPDLRGRIYYLGLCVAHAASEYHRMVESGPLTISAFTIAGDRLGLARAYNALAVASLNTGRIDDAATYVDTALRFYEQLGHARGVATAVINQGSVLFEGRGDLEGARDSFCRAIQLLGESNLTALGGVALGNLAEVEYAMAAYDASVERARRAADHFETVASPPMIAWQHQTLARCSLARGDLAVGSEHLLVACDLLRRTPQPMYLARLAEIAARRLLLGGNPKGAALAIAAAGRFRAERSLIQLGPFAGEVHADEAAVAERLGADGFAAVERTVVSWDLTRLCDAIGELLVAG